MKLKSKSLARNSRVRISGSVWQRVQLSLALQVSS
ncbi:hypothetical protein MED222_05375 [Vibrio sp. MED222]|nr:hypothetical protein MED222_05375 [Vibrio sp. MED222]